VAIATGETNVRHLTIEARTIRKVQIRIIPFIFLLFVVAFLDRINIEFAALTMKKELALSSRQLDSSPVFSSLATAFLKCPAAVRRSPSKSVLTIRACSRPSSIGTIRYCSPVETPLTVGLC
jgi:hypothetical protein